MIWVVGDVAVWDEPDWHVSGKRKKEYFRKGDRRVTAQVVDIGRTFIKLKVMSCEVIFDQSASGVKLLKEGEEITRNLEKFKARKAARAPWGGADGEDARAAVTSSFLKPPPKK